MEETNPSVGLQKAFLVEIVEEVERAYKIIFDCATPVCADWCGHPRCVGFF